MGALQERAQRDAKAQAEAAARLQSVHRGRRTRRKLQAGEDPAAVAVSMARAAAMSSTVIRGDGAPTAHYGAPSVLEPLAMRASAPTAAFVPSAPTAPPRNIGKGALNEKLKWAIGTQTALISASKGAASLGSHLEAADLT